MFLHRDEVEAREEVLRRQVRELPDAMRKEFYAQAERQIRDPDTYAVLNYLFIAGLHHFYLRRWVRGLINLAIFGAGIYLIVIGLWQNGLIVIAAITVLEFYALFRSQIIVKAYNNAIMEKILASLHEE